MLTDIAFSLLCILYSQCLHNEDTLTNTTCHFVYFTFFFISLRSIQVPFLSHIQQQQQKKTKNGGDNFTFALTMELNMEIWTEEKTNSK